MSYRISAKNRRFKRWILKILSFIKFDGFHLDNSQKTVAFGAILWIISLFFPWIEILDSDVNLIKSGFSKILWITGIILLFLNMFILFLVFQHKNKEIVKNMLSIFLKDGVAITFLSTFILLVSVNSIFLIEWLKTFQQGIILWNGVIISLVSAVFCVVWGVMITKTKGNTTIFNPDYSYTDDNFDWLHHESKVDEKNNMKLPF